MRMKMKGEDRINNEDKAEMRQPGRQRGGGGGRVRDKDERKVMLLCDIP